MDALAAAVCALYVVVASWWVNVDRGADPREMLVSTQSATSFTIKGDTNRFIGFICIGQ